MLELQTTPHSLWRKEASFAENESGEGDHAASKIDEITGAKRAIPPTRQRIDDEGDGELFICLEIKSQKDSAPMSKLEERNEKKTHLDGYMKELETNLLLWGANTQEDTAEEPG